MYPSDRKYTTDFGWIRVDGTEATVGVTDVAQNVLNDLVTVELPEVGRSFARGEEFLLLESVKAAIELVAPVSGEVIAVNAELREHPKRFAADPHGIWIVKLRLKELTEVATLLSHTEFAELVRRTRQPRPSEKKAKPAPPSQKQQKQPKFKPAPDAAPRKPRTTAVEPTGPTLKERQQLALKTATNALGGKTWTRRFAPRREQLKRDYTGGSILSERSHRNCGSRETVGSGFAKRNLPPLLALEFRRKRSDHRRVVGSGSGCGSDHLARAEMPERRVRQVAPGHKRTQMSGWRHLARLTLVVEADLDSNQPGSPCTAFALPLRHRAIREM
jgi:glycine cleavage system H protein